MIVYRETILDCPPELVWNEVQKSSLLVEVCRPLITFRPVAAAEFPPRWIDGSTLRCKSYLLGFLPLGTRTLTFDCVDQSAREIHTRENDPLVRRWDHVVRVADAKDGRTQYSDHITIEAGLLTLAVWLFAYFFYGHRQRRWKTVARRLQVRT